MDGIEMSGAEMGSILDVFFMCIQTAGKRGRVE